MNAQDSPQLDSNTNIGPHPISEPAVPPIIEGAYARQEERNKRTYASVVVSTDSPSIREAGLYSQRKDKKQPTTMFLFQ